MRTRLAIVLLSLCAATAVAATAIPRAARPAPGAVRRAQITFFYQGECERCEKAKPVVEAYARRHSELPLERVDIGWLEGLERRQAYDAAYRVPEARQLEVPAMFVGEQAYVGVEAFEKLARGEGAVLSWREQFLGRYGPIVLRVALLAALLATAAVAALGASGAGISLAVRLFLGGLLALSGGSKLLRFTAAAAALAEQWRLPHGVAVTLLASTLAAELLVAGLLLRPHPPRWGRAAAVVLFGGFLTYTVIARVFSISGDCGCFPWREALGWSTIARNLGFATLSLALLRLPNENVGMK